MKTKEQILKFIKLEKVLRNKDYEKNIEILESGLDQINLYINMIEGFDIKINIINQNLNNMINDYKNKIHIKEVRKEIRLNNNLIKELNKDKDSLNKEKEKILNFIENININKNKERSEKYDYKKNLKEIDFKEKDKILNFIEDMDKKKELKDNK